MRPCVRGKLKKGTSKMRKLMRVAAGCMAVCIAGLLWGTAQTARNVEVDEFAYFINNDDCLEPRTAGSWQVTEGSDLHLLERVIASERCRLGIERDFTNVRDEVLRFMLFVKNVESDGDRYAQASTSSAMSFFQFTVPSVPTAVNRLERYMSRRTLGPLPMWAAELRGKPELLFEVSELRQAILAFVNIVEQRGSDQLLNRYLSGERAVAKDIYFVHHHTDPDTATTRRAEAIFSKVLN